MEHKRLKQRLPALVAARTQPEDNRRQSKQKDRSCGSAAQSCNVKADGSKRDEGEQKGRVPRIAREEEANRTEHFKKSS